VSFGTISLDGGRARLLGCDWIHDSGNTTERNFVISCKRLFTTSEKIFATSGLCGIACSPPHDAA